MTGLCCGAYVASWHIRDIARSQIEVRVRCKSGHAADIMAMTGFAERPIKSPAEAGLGLLLEGS
jgi:hypothetical protein